MSNDDDADLVSDDAPDEKASKRPGRSKVGKEPEKKTEKVNGAETHNPNDTINGSNENTNTSVANGVENKNTVEHVYQKKTQLEHILLRPDTYIGSVDFTEEQDMWVYDAKTEKIVNRRIRYVPGLYKIFDEILVNAADNKQRDPKMSVIKVDINKETNTISVYNNGKGIPVVIHKDEKMYVPELIFGTLLTSSNYNDSEKKVTGGRNGYGAKLCNIFSKEFTLETSSREYGKAFKQTWINSMTKDKEPNIVSSTVEDFTKVTFKPDLSKFKMTELDDDTVSLLMRRAFDVAGSTHGIKVFLNGYQLPVQGFKQYVEMYTKGSADDIIYEKVDRWEIALTVSAGTSFKQVSFVNSIATSRGGTHVEYVADNICKSMLATIRKKTEKTTIKVGIQDIKPHMWIFVNCLIENPSFDSQTKETLTLKPSCFGSHCDFSDNFYRKVNKSGIVESVLAWVDFQEQEILRKQFSSKKDTKLTGITKLEDANDAGTAAHSLECTLIVTEGDSAKTLAVAGLAVVGRDRYGVFPLRGKLLNVREGSVKQMTENHEINALVKILGLQYKKKYITDADFRTLRYGKIMIMADQDQDGSHIKGLIINFIHHYWPTLIHNNFVEQFITPIIKAIRVNEELPFFSIPEFQEWKKNAPNSDQYRIKYYKGLGTSTSKEAKEYFSDMARHRIKFTYAGPEDDAAVMMAFSRKKIEERKDWLSTWMAEKKTRRAQGLDEEYLYNKNTRSVTYSEFINKELVLFSNTDNERSIPCLVDGFKPGQRKVLFSCLKRADKHEVKVAQLAGAVGELSAYHHGEASLMGTIVNLAQDFVGSNNINLLLPIGQFGTRLQGGKDSASPRYIFTKLNPITRTLFPSADENVLRFLDEDNQRIEPEWYCPIIPMVLVNGATGIGTAWSTNIPNYNPREIVENVRRLIRGEQQLPLMPWYKGFTGKIIQLDGSRYVCNGEVAVLDDTTVEITELPVKTWTQTYKEQVIEPAVESRDRMHKGERPIFNFKEYHTDTTVRFVCNFSEKLDDDDKKELHRTLKLQTVINTTSMMLFDASGCLRKFNSPEEITAEFYEVRKQKYIERKAFLEGMLKAQSDRLANQARFIVAKVKGEVILENKKKAIILDQLIKLKFAPDPVKKWKDGQKEKLGEVEVEQPGEEMSEIGEDGLEVVAKKGKDETEIEKKLAPYEYLLSLPLIKVSDEEKQKLLKASKEKLADLKRLQNKSWSDLWEEDLARFLNALDKSEQEKKEKEATMLKRAGPGRSGISDNVYPSHKGQRVDPFIDQAMKDKYEKMNASKLPKTPKEPKTPRNPRTERGKTPKPDKPKRDEWKSDQSDDDADEEEKQVNLFENEEEEDLLEQEEYFPKQSSARGERNRARARALANASRMAEEINEELFPKFRDEEENEEEEDEEEESDEEPPNDQPVRHPIARTYEDLVEEKRLREIEWAKEDQRRGIVRKPPTPPPEKDEDSDDSVVIIDPPEDKEPRRTGFRRRLLDKDTLLEGDGATVRGIYISRVRMPWLFKERPGSERRQKSKTPTPEPEPSTSRKTKRNPDFEMPPEPEDAEEYMAAFRAQMPPGFYDLPCSSKSTSAPVADRVITKEQEIKDRAEWRILEEHKMMRDPSYKPKPFPKHMQCNTEKQEIYRYEFEEKKPDPYPALSYPKANTTEAVKPKRTRATKKDEAGISASTPRKRTYTRKPKAVAVPEEVPVTEDLQANGAAQNGNVLAEETPKPPAKRVKPKKLAMAKQNETAAQPEEEAAPDGVEANGAAQNGNAVVEETPKPSAKRGKLKKQIVTKQNETETPQAQLEEEAAADTPAQEQANGGEPPVGRRTSARQAKRRPIVCEDTGSEEDQSPKKNTTRSKRTRKTQ